MTSINVTNGASQTVQRLEIEDGDERLTRMHNIFMQLDSKSTSAGAHLQKPLTFDFGDRSTFAVEPPTALLSRVQAFLPQLAASNAQLELHARENPRSVDIESVRDGETYIQMKLGLGVYESHDSAAKASLDIDMHPERTLSSSSDSRFGSNDSSSSDIDTEMSNGSDSDTDSDASSIDIISAFTSALPRPIRPLPKRSPSRPGIVVLGSGITLPSLDPSPPSVLGSK